MCSVFLGATCVLKVSQDLRYLSWCCNLEDQLEVVYPAQRFYSHISLRRASSTLPTPVASAGDLTNPLVHATNMAVQKRSGQPGSGPGGILLGAACEQWGAEPMAGLLGFTALEAHRHIMEQLAVSSWVGCLFKAARLPGGVSVSCPMLS